LFLRFEVKSDPSKHIVLAKTEQLERDEFFKKLHTNMDQTGKNLLVFIHGYNVSFEDAARRTAQMAVDLEFQGAPVFYSWPSHNDWYRYPDDALNIQASVGQIRAFLEQLARDSGAEAIHLVAHSMGNVGLTQALAKLESDGPMFHQVILAAPDIDAGVFKEQIAPRITSKAKRVTLYTSQTDLALLASRYFNQGHRVGDSSQGVVVFPGIETIDATSIDSSLLGHSYYGSSVNVLEDIANLLKDLPITNRNYLEMQPNQTPPYWSFAPRYRMANRP
jgi:esterase/lipase superfamily enzyme